MSDGHEELAVWASLFDPVDPTNARLWHLADGDPALYMQFKLTMIMAEERLGVDGMERLGQRVPDTRLKMKQMAGYLQSGGSWLDLAGDLGIPWEDQARIVCNMRGPFPLLAWDEGTQMDFEQDVRRGWSIRKLEREYHLSYKLARTLARMIRGDPM